MQALRRVIILGLVLLLGLCFSGGCGGGPDPALVARRSAPAGGETFETPFGVADESPGTDSTDFPEIDGILLLDDEPSAPDDALEEGLPEELDAGGEGDPADDGGFEELDAIVTLDDDPDDKSLAPYVPTPLTIVEEMLKMAGVTAEDTVYDLGCGDGRVLIMAARKFGAKGVGVELDQERCAETAARIKELGLDGMITVKHGDLLEEDVSPATVVFLYLLPEANAKLKDRLKKALKPGSRVVSHDFSVPGWKPVAEKTIEREEEAFDHTIFVYRM
jgi:hypothetical protein